MKNYKPAFIVLGVIGVLLLALDLWLAASPYATESQAMNYLAHRCRTMPTIFGILMAHWFWPAKVVRFRRLRNIGLIIFLGWWLWDLINGIIGNWSVAGSNVPIFLVFLICLPIGRVLWPQEKI